ncbi:uncharacterized protein LOC113280276 [Papaver somniferum]|uniref:uncharacterized protein LOC113280276 n=1 Tax=Papaver somniferum TaxID=3469 RepID=UPI000E703D5E|nr:uncharacterized protein LOC113280276 [Papaver somniferum]
MASLRNSSNSVYIFAYFLLFAVLFRECSSSEENFGKVRVKVMNQLNNGQNLWLHCWVQRGYRKIEQTIPDNQSVTWSFGLTFIGKTYYDCDFGWNKQGIMIYKRQQVYNERVDGYCEDDICNWAARQDGIYRQNAGWGWSLVVHW